MSNNTEVYLKQESHYIDRYDLLTINDCLFYARSLYSKLPEVMKDPKLQEVPEEKRKNDWLRAINMVVHGIKLERFKHKAKTINDWISGDKNRQDRYDLATPLELYCPKCNVLMNDWHKSLHDYNQPLKVLFMYRCPRCNLNDAYFDDGNKYETKPTLCEKCGCEVKVSLKDNKKTGATTWTYKCTSCDYKQVDVHDHKKWLREQEEQDKKDKELVEKFRTEYCFTEKEGNEAVTWMENWTRLMNDIDAREAKEKDPDYQKAKNLKKLKVLDVNKLLKEAMEREGFVNLEFEKPDFGRFVAVPFVIQESKEDRKEYDSEKQLKRLVNSTLEDSNWRLMSEGISYRAGYLSGRLRCYEKEEEIMEVLKDGNK